MNRKKYKAIIIGIILGTLVSFSPGSLFMLILAGASVWFICRIWKGGERKFLLSIFLSGLAVRVALVLLVVCAASFSGHVLNYASRGCPDFSTPYIIPDSGYYTLRAWFTTLYFSGMPLSVFTIKGIVKNTYGFSGLFYILALFFKAFGYSPVSSRFINCFLGSSSGILVYFTLKTIFNERPARLAAVLTMFFPSLILWSITNLKETSMIFAVCAMLFFLVRFQKTKRFYYLLSALMSILFYAFIRGASYGTESFVIGVAITALYCFYLYMHRLSLRKRAIILLLTFTIGGTAVVFGKDKIVSATEGALQKVLVQHRGTILTRRGICYRLLPGEYYRDTTKTLDPIDAVKMFYRGWFHVMLEPLPWRVQSKDMMIVFPQIILWYTLIPFAISGVVILIRRRFRESVYLIVYFFIMTSVLAMAGSNVGTIFRQRDVNTPIFLMFSSVGLINAFSTLTKGKGSR